MELKPWQLIVLIVVLLLGMGYCVYRVPVPVQKSPTAEAAEELFRFVGNGELVAQGGKYSVHLTVSKNNVTRLELTSSDATWQLIIATDIHSDGDWESLDFCTTRNFYNPLNEIPDTCDKSNPQSPENEELLDEARSIFPVFPGQ